jgi:RNA polymerase sigma factor (sigma-70 family)
MNEVSASRFEENDDPAVLLATIFEKYKKNIIFILECKKFERSDIEDAIQETFLYFLSNKIYSFSEKLLFVCVLRRCLNMKKTKERRRGHFKEYANRNLQTHAIDILESVIAKEDRGKVEENIRAMSDADQQLVTLRYTAGLSVREIASIVGYSQSQTSRRILNILEKLQTAFDHGNSEMRVA